MIDPGRRAEFEQLTRAEIRSRTLAGPYSAEWRRDAEDYLDELERGPERRAAAESARSAAASARIAKMMATVAVTSLVIVAITAIADRWAAIQSTMQSALQGLMQLVR
jgi:hypothetical protein